MQANVFIYTMLPFLHFEDIAGTSHLLWGKCSCWKISRVASTETISQIAYFTEGKPIPFHNECELVCEYL